MKVCVQVRNIDVYTHSQFIHLTWHYMGHVDTETVISFRHSPKHFHYITIYKSLLPAKFTIGSATLNIKNSDFSVIVLYWCP